MKRYTGQRLAEGCEVGTYERSSVLAGQTRRQWLDEFPSLAEAQALKAYGGRP